MYGPTTCGATPNAISSPGSACGLTPSGAPDGPTNSLYGPPVARANLSARQAAEAGLLTSGTYGLTSSTCYASAALSDALASKFRARTASLGSTLYNLTWKARATPQARLIYALRASAPRISDSDCTGWPTPNTGLTPNGHGQRGGTAANGHQSGADLQGVAKLCGWPTPNASDGSGGGQAKRVGGPHSAQLADYAMLSGSPPPQGPARRTATGAVLIGSCAAMPDGGQLNPALPRWLQGLPAAWDDCADTAILSSRRSRKSL
jgi:hypothetical protein